MTHADAPAAIGPYSQAIKAGDLVFVSGCIPLDPSTMQIVSGGVEEQTKQALKNFKAVIEARGSSVDKVVKTTVCSRIYNIMCFSGIYIFAGIPEVNGRLRNRQRHLRRILWIAQAGEVTGGSRTIAERRVVRNRMHCAQRVDG